MGDDYDDYLESFNDPPFRGIRINTLKANKDILDYLPFVKGKVPFCSDGYYIDSDTEKLGNHPIHIAGGIYIQEPSAMCAVEMLDVKKGDTVLDLCAAPGSKSTQIASKLDGEGLLWSNEIVRSRANILLTNIERCGIRNAVITSLSPEILCTRLKGVFDKVLVDAPCSGEGMFRKDKKAREEWSLEHVISCSQRQYKILCSAKEALKGSGVLIYSTCTFSKEENEGVIERFLDENRDFTLLEIKRVYPSDGGEGHFAAKLQRKNVESERAPLFDFGRIYDKDETIREFIKDIFKDDRLYNIYVKNDGIYSMPFTAGSMKSLSDIQFIRAGIKIGEIKKNRIEPHHNLFTSFKNDEYLRNIDLSLDDDRVQRYLKGEEIETGRDFKGFTGVSVQGISLGYGKAVGDRLKNKFPKGLRIF